MLTAHQDSGSRWLLSLLKDASIVRTLLVQLGTPLNNLHTRPGGDSVWACDRGMPEDVGMAAAQLLCDEVSKGGCVDSTHQSLVFLLMTLCPEDVSRVRVGQLTDYR